MLNVIELQFHRLPPFMYGSILTNLFFDLENKKITVRDGLGTILFISI